jgi:hypothetical protein
MSNIAATLSLNVPAITALCLGARGSIIFAASGLPNNPNNTYGGNPGLSGDYYVDNSTGNYYGPKTNTWPTSALFTLNNTVSSVAYTLVAGTTSLIIPQYGNNRLFVNSIGSAILGGQNNSLTGNNSFVIGSNITAAITGFTLTNNISSTGSVFASAGNSNQWSTTYTIVTSNSANWNSAYVGVTGVSAQNISVFTAVSPNSANWNSTYTTVSAGSGTWNTAYTVVSGLAYLTYSLNSTLSTIVPSRGTFTASGTASNIGGGNFNNVLSSYASVLGGKYNTASGNYSNITGGFSSVAAGCYSNIAGGNCNTASGYSASIGGGTGNVASGFNAAIAAGAYNTSSCCSSFVGGGKYNTASGIRSVVVGGYCNTASGDYSYIASGSANNTKGYVNTFILGTGLSASKANYSYFNNISSQGIVSDSTGTSLQWNNTYTNLASNSANWNNTFTRVAASSANWSNAYTYLNTNTATTLTVNNLTVNGTSGFASTLTVNDNTSIGYINGSSTGLSLTKGATYGIPSIQGITTTNTTTQNIAINPNGGNVGIGTVSPSSGGGGKTLDIEGGASNASIRLGMNTSTGDLFAAGTDLYIQQSNSGGGIMFRTNSGSTNNMYIAGAGYVGINTVTPNQALTVVGNITTTGVISAGNGGGVYYADSSNLALRPPAVSAPNGATFFQNNAGSVTTMYVDSNTNYRVGIGTSSPATTLQVNGETNFLTVSETKATPAISSSTLTLNLATATLFYVTLNSSIGTLTLSNPPASPRVFSFTLQLVGDGTARTITWPGSVRWQGGLAPTPTATLNKVDTYVFFTHDGGSNYFAFTAGQNA